MAGKAQAAELVAKTIAEHKVVVFSKTHCPYCIKAKNALNKLLQPSAYFVMELDQRNDCIEIQDALMDVTGARSVPRVFVGGKFIGGGDDTDRKANDGTLKQLLADAGAL